MAAADREFAEGREALKVKAMAVALVAQAIGVEQVERGRTQAGWPTKATGPNVTLAPASQPQPV